ncbi:A/G-specific adenine glycosylase [Rhizorhapis sp. SPR117]|uniref:A/G-specific adenine glycosylase n=1 Tax=Rhizorhapis sp. SPR117 TaxID=2912611 RepID=UPI001F0006C2|nr:A/G-specific adenine glycosylase [Rhizorhapis sp. SPR117]
MKQTSGISVRLLAHYDSHARTLPWRSAPGANAADPYRVWLSEIMLQQTTVAAVKPYFEKFTVRWPDVMALADADEAELMAAWAGLGYYARARNLLACARIVAKEHGGDFPANEAALRVLPGIGAYTAAAIAAIAFGKRAVVVDANVERVVARLFAIGTPLPQARTEIRTATDRITPDMRAGDFAQAMMDLGATVCTVRNPLCALCPLNADCAAYAAGDPTGFPVKPARKARPERHGYVWWMQNDGHVWLIRRPGKGLLGGMRALPTSAWDKEPDYAPPIAGQWNRVAAPIVHVFTHFALNLQVEWLHIERDCMTGQAGEWWPIDAMNDAGLPTLFAKAAWAVMEEIA